MDKIKQTAFTFDDVLIVPRQAQIPQGEISLKTKLTSTGIILNAPIMSAPMENVTEARMAITIARQGGIGIIHKHLSIEEQAAEVDKVKRSEFGVIKCPISLNPNKYVYEAEALMKKYRISGIPVTDMDTLVGIITNRDIRFESDHNKKIYEVMTRENLITAPVGTTFETAKAILDQHKIEKLPLVDESGDLKGLITTKDIIKAIEYPNSAKDADGSLLVGAAVDIGDEMLERITVLVANGVDVIALDTPHGHTQAMAEAISAVKEAFPSLPIIAGNVATAQGAEALIKAGANAIRVGVGTESVSNTGVRTGAGVPQLTAIMDCAKATRAYGIPLIADGGIKVSGDILKAIVAGADVVMIGGMLAEGRMDHKHAARDLLIKIVANIREGLHYCGAATVEEAILHGAFNHVTRAGYTESLPHGIERRRMARGKHIKRYY